MPQLSFPSAYGAGAYTVGGRTGTVYKVTNLNDSGAGSFRDAVSQPNRVIIFDVSGIINLSSILSFSDNLTILGQTAPVGGITIDGERVFIQDTDNIIVRYIRFKGGVDGNNDSVTIRGSITNQIFDHCSFGFGADEGASWYEASVTSSVVNNLTVQKCLFSESKTGAIIGAGTGNSNAGNMSFLNNLFFNVSHRFPNTSGENANIDVINNIVWNVSSRLIRVNGQGQNLNHISNYYHYNNRGINDDRINAFSYENGYPNIYTNGNKIVAPVVSSPLTSTIAEMNLDNTLSWKHFIDGTSTPLGTRNKGDQLESNYFTNTQHPIVGRGINILSADDAFTQVKDDVGANITINEDGSTTSNLDTEDTSYINAINSNTYVPRLSDVDKNVTPFTSVTRPAGYYVTNQHIPEVWGQANISGFSSSSHTELAPSGYTWLEEFANQADTVGAGSSPVITRTDSNPTSYIVGQTYLVPSGVWNDVEDGSGIATVGGDVVPVDGSGNLTTAGTYNVTLQYTDTDGNTGTLVVPIIVTASSNNILYELTNSKRLRGRASLKRLVTFR